MTDSPAADRIAPVVSVVVPTHNRSALLRETVSSILSQTLRGLELIVVSDGSTDDTRLVVESFADPRIVLIEQPAAGRPAVPRNRGIALARGEYVAFCDDDDLWMPDKLACQVAAMSERSDAGLCFTDGIAFRGNDVVANSLVAGRKRRFLGAFNWLLLDNHLPSCSVMVRRTVFDQVGLMDESRELVAVEDWEMWLRIARSFPLVFVDRPLVRYRIHQNLTARPSITALRGVTVINTASRKLGVNPLLRASALGYQYLKYAWFLASGR